MPDQRTLEDLKDRGSGVPASPDVVRLYRGAFAEFGTRALWSWRRDIEHPTFTQALAVAASLRTEGGCDARTLAVQIEQACRAAL